MMLSLGRSKVKLKTAMTAQFAQARTGDRVCHCVSLSEALQSKSIKNLKTLRSLYNGCSANPFKLFAASE